MHRPRNPRPPPISCARDADWHQYDGVQVSDESTREGSEDPDMY